MSLFKCENQTCKSSGNFVACLYCGNSFYCSVNCRDEDSHAHQTICNSTNTRQMLQINTKIAKKIQTTLSNYASIKNRLTGPGIVNVRSYDSIWDVDNKPVRLFISYIPLDNWTGNVPTVLENDYSKQMIVNFHIEDMNKPQLHRFKITSLNPNENMDLCVTI